MANEAPGKIGPYRLLNIVHTSQHYRLWQAYDDLKQRRAAVKTLLEQSRKNREQIGDLRWEYSVGQKVCHPRLIEMFQFGVDRGCHYLAMEWFPAPNMKQMLRQGIDKIAPLLPKIVQQAAEGLGHVNSLGWVHRDVKPDNFLVSDEGEVKLIDLGLARRARRGLAKLFPFKSKVQGTRSYMAPEQIRGAGLDARADVYSFGCTIFELLAGRPPFTGVSANDLLKKHLKAAPPSLEAVNSDVTPEFSHLVRCCMAKDPAERPESLDVFLAEFEAIRILTRAANPPQTSQN